MAVDEVTRIIQELSAKADRVEYMEEALADMAAKLGDMSGWEQVGFNDEGLLTLDELKQMSKQLQDMVAQSPLMKRGAQLRYGYVFGQGMNILNLDGKPRVKKFVDLPAVRRSLLSTTGQESLNTTRFTDGNIFVLRSTKNDKVIRVPLKQVTGVVTDPDDAETIWYIKRSWTTFSGTTKKDNEKWYRVNGYEPAKEPTSITDNGGKSVPVDKAYIMHVHRANRLTGQTWGLPDGYAAMKWLLAYTEYLQNNSTLVAAYAKIAYKVSTNTKTGGQIVGAQVAQAGAGGIASMGLDANLTAVPATGSTVSFQNGRPLAAMVAAALGVSVVALLSDPGAAGSSYGSAQTLDTPTLKVMIGLQNNWKEFFEDILLAVQGGSETPIAIDFPSIDNDPVYRALASLQAGFQTGALFQSEYRAAFLKISDVDPIEAIDKLPKPTAFTPSSSTGGNQPKQPTATTAGGQPATNDSNAAKSGETDNSKRTDTLSTGDSK